MADDKSKSRSGLDSLDCVFRGRVPALGVVQPREKTRGAVRLESLSRNVLQFQLPLSPSKKMPDHINLSLVDNKKKKCFRLCWWFWTHWSAPNPNGCFNVGQLLLSPPSMSLSTPPTSCLGAPTQKTTPTSTTASSGTKMSSLPSSQVWTRTQLIVMPFKKNWYGSWNTWAMLLDEVLVLGNIGVFL